MLSSPYWGACQVSRPRDRLVGAFAPQAPQNHPLRSHLTSPSLSPEHLQDPLPPGLALLSSTPLLPPPPCMREPTALLRGLSWLSPSAAPLYLPRSPTQCPLLGLTYQILEYSWHHSAHLASPLPRSCPDLKWPCCLPGSLSAHTLPVVVPVCPSRRSGAVGSLEKKACAVLESSCLEESQGPSVPTDWLPSVGSAGQRPWGANGGRCSSHEGWPIPGEQTGAGPIVVGNILRQSQDSCPSGHPISPCP